MDQFKDIIPTNLKALQVSGDSSQTISAERFALHWARVCAAYPRQETSTATAEVYFEALQGYGEKQVSEAITEVLRSCKWFPTIAEIVAEIKSPKGCIHNLILAQIRSKEMLLIEAEKHSDRKLKRLAEEVAEIEDRKVELYRRDREMLEKSGLPEAQKKLAAVNQEIKEQERVLTILRSKVKLLDQARILQADEMN